MTQSNAAPPTSDPTDRSAHLSRKRFLKQAVAAAGLAAVGMKTVGEKTVQAAAVFGDAIAGNGPFGLRVRNSRSAANTAAVRGELTSTTSGVAAAGVIGSNAGTNIAGIGVFGTHAGGGVGVRGNSKSGTGVVGQSSSFGGIGVHGIANGGFDATAVQGTARDGVGVAGRSTEGNGTGVSGRAEGDEGIAVGGVSPNIAVYGERSGTGQVGYLGHPDGGVKGQDLITGTTGRLGTSRDGVSGTTTDPTGAGVYGQSFSGIGVFGDASGKAGVYGYSSNAQGTFGESDAGAGAHGKSFGGNGVYGETGGTNAAGVFGTSPYVGVWGKTTGTNSNAQGVRGVAPTGSSAWAGYFSGNLGCSGTLTKGGGAFKIDHPLDPANQYLYHSFVESPEMKNIYDGVVTTGADGTASVEMPGYFEALNRDFCYQLTVMGQFAQAIVSQEITGNHFTIRTSKPSVKVSWQVTGIRHDPWAEANRIPVEETKEPAEQGTYLHPDAYGQPETLAAPLSRRAARGAGEEFVQSPAERRRD